VIETDEILKCGSIDSLRIGFALVALLGYFFFEWSMRVAVTIAAVRASQLTVDVDDHSGFTSSWPGVIAGENASCGSGDDHCLVPRKETKRDANGPIISRETQSRAVERVDQDSADACR
jgi:hypothetical protein